MTKKKFSVLMLAGCMSAGCTLGTPVFAEQMEGEMEYGIGETGYPNSTVQADQNTIYEDTAQADQNAIYEDTVQVDQNMVYGGTEQEPQTGTDTWVPDYTESYDSSTEYAAGTEYSEPIEYYDNTEYYDNAEINSEDTEISSETESETERRYYKDDPYIEIRKTDKVKFAEDFDILTKEDAEEDFELLSFDELPRAVSLEVPSVLQLPELPTGCESVALTMALEYEGFMLYKTTIAREFLIYNQETDNMAIGYIGDPFSEDGAGCFAPAIAATADNFFEDQEADYVAYDISGTEMEELLSYVQADTPVVLWTTMYMAEPEFTEDTAEYEGKTYRWYYQEHCVVLSGYDLDNNTVQINDPLEGIVTRDYDEFKNIYDKIGKYAVVVKKTAEEK